MDATIKIKLSELNAGFIEHLKALFQGKEDAELTLTIGDHPNHATYLDILSRSKNDLETGNGLTSFTMEELETYTRSKQK